jgi:flagellar biosynthetic protein FlhB
MADAHGEKTEKPTPKRLRDARERGQVAVSRDVPMALGSLAATGVLVGAGTFLLQRMTTTIVNTLTRLGDAPLRDVTADELMPLVTSGGLLLALMAGPVAMAAAASGLIGSVVQTGFNVSTQPLVPSWQRLSPATNIRRLGISRAGVDTLKAIVTSVILGILSWRIAKALATEAGALTWTGPVVSADHGWAASIKLLWQAGFALLAVGAIDFGIQRWRLRSSLKMTKQEIKDEAKHSETNPEIKARVRRIQREMVRRRMLQAVPKATVVLTNPTHYAVALEYKRDKTAAPVVVAKGADLLAMKIREIARGHSVPIVENPALTRALYKECEIGDVIPGPLFGAVAEVLAYLIRIKQLVL